MSNFYNVRKPIQLNKLKVAMVIIFGMLFHVAETYFFLIDKFQKLLPTPLLVSKVTNCLLSRYLMLHLRSISFQDLTLMPGHISAQVPSSITIYGLSLIVKRELGPCTLNIRIYQPKDEGREKEEMNTSKKLTDFGFVGTLPPDEPEPVTLLYDYDYPLLDDPLLMANFSL